jgi:hypothetical protein
MLKVFGRERENERIRKGFVLSPTRRKKVYWL